ncbi:rRNA biogenesis protein RRP5, putative (RRP5) [Plasmodium ovale wallikeri]|uniref:rRNA biogenesis protein RRP5, putative n=2 Tax=Plasmodium ovale TaxID=36330 RepID=A0A1C3KXT0_PLAOA|nr:rRNA biogenesis protein RRP5, putative (RRP5) [Plasmodium ovale wallikeri]SBT47108.1 rRNA biogenesis protein RRP5, putative (RRP5) [Plasmodium ovale wallikeri]SBT79021.1 rRNA biogenesis protein RRP5, putative [Plasmodium ovale]
MKKAGGDRKRKGKVRVFTQVEGESGCKIKEGIKVVEGKKKRKKMEGTSVTRHLNNTSSLSIYAQVKRSEKENEERNGQGKRSAKGGHVKLRNRIPYTEKRDSEEAEGEGEGEEESSKAGERAKQKGKKQNMGGKMGEEIKTSRGNTASCRDNARDNGGGSGGDGDEKGIHPGKSNTKSVTPADYEKLLASEKNKSAIWISYIAYYLEKGNIQEARKVAERALKTIDIHQVEEKKNIYLSYINMECAYGDKLYDIFKRALLCNNEKNIYIHTINVLKKNNKWNELKELCEQAIRKFKYSKKIWSCYLEILHNTFNDEQYAHNILLKSLHSLPKRKHLNMIINAARFEYKYSNKERGKNYFEKLIQEYPKRSDVWFTYLDIHINSLVKRKIQDDLDRDRKSIHVDKKGKLNSYELQFIRNIFERFLAIKFKTRVMKMIFTKWLLFEKNYGSVNTQKMVQQKAYNYVESLNSEA